MQARILAGLALVALAAPAFAEGDAAKGATQFNKCKACHSIIKDDGTAIIKGGMVGPNLYGVIGRAAGTGKKAGSADAFAYGQGLQELGKTGMVWTQQLLADYVKNPTAFVKAQTKDTAAKSNMAFMLPSGGEDVAAYLASVGPASN